MPILTEVPGTTDRGTRNRERGTAFGMYFYTTGTKMFPVPVPGTAFSEHGTHPRSTFPVTMLLPAHVDSKLS